MNQKEDRMIFKWGRWFYQMQKFVVNGTVEGLIEFLQTNDLKTFKTTQKCISAVTEIAHDT